MQAKPTPKVGDLIALPDRQVAGRVISVEPNDWTPGFNVWLLDSSGYNSVFPGSPKHYNFSTADDEWSFA